jgi:hypothetical protein
MMLMLAEGPLADMFYWVAEGVDYIRLPHWPDDNPEPTLIRYDRTEMVVDGLRVYRYAGKEEPDGEARRQSA